MKRIMVLSRKLTSGGAERVAANVASQLKDENTKTWLVVFDGSDATYPCTTEMIDLKLPSQKGMLRKTVWYIKIWKKIRNLKRELHITHTISFLNEPDLINVLTSKQNKTIVSVRNKRSALNKNIITKIKDQFVFKKADKVVALSTGVRDDLIDFYNVDKEKIQVIYNACEVDVIKKRASETVDAEKLESVYIKGKTVITAGRLTEQKGQWHLIRAFKRVVQVVPDAHLLILGQGEEKSYLEKLIGELKLESNVFLMGYCANPYFYLYKADLFVFSSLYEGFGNILLEAMACDLPIVSSDCVAGPRELLEPGTSYDMSTTDGIVEAQYGILVPVCDGKKKGVDEELTKEEVIMADAIINMLTNKKMLEKYREKSKKRVSDFSTTKIYKQWRELLDTVPGEK